MLVFYLQIFLLALTLIFSSVSHRQTSRILAFDVAASRIHLDFEQVSAALQNFYDELREVSPSRPYVEALQADLHAKVTQLENCIATLLDERGSASSVVAIADPEMMALLSYVAPRLKTFTERARSFATSDFETLRLRYARPSIVDLSAARTGRVRMTLEQISNNAQSRQANSIDGIHNFILIAIGLLLTLLLFSWFFIIRPALAKQREAILRESEYSASLSKKNAALQIAENSALVLYEDARRGVAARTEFLAVVSHELRTPLNAVIGFSEIMKDEVFGKHTVPSYREYSNDIHTSGRHLLDIVNDILDFSRYESQKMTLEENDVAVGKVFSNARTIVSNKADEANVSLDFTDRTDRGDTLTIDKRLVNQALINIIDNAVKFSPTGNIVRVEADYSPDGALVIRVSDNGIGIDRDAIPRLLQPFEQAEGAFSRASGGVGLGLAIANKVMLAHDGRIDIDSAPESGCRVNMVFPAARLRRIDTGVPAPRNELKA